MTAGPSYGDRFVEYDGTYYERLEDGHLRKLSDDEVRALHDRSPQDAAATPSGDGGADPAVQTSAGQGQLLDANGGSQLVAVRFTEEEATDTQPAKYLDRSGRVVVDESGAMRIQFVEAPEAQ
jgi:hypothetical protein